MKNKFQQTKSMFLWALPLAFLFTFFTGCKECPKCPETLDNINVSEDTSLIGIDKQFNMDGLKTKFAYLTYSSGPLPSELVKALKDDCAVFYTHRQHPNTKLNFINSTINLKDFLVYVNRPGDFNAIRFYPAFNAENQVQLIMTRTNGTEASGTFEDFDYTLLRNDYSMGGFPESIGEEQARSFVSDFFTNVYINNAIQDPAADNYKKSRLFLWDEIHEFLHANISNFNPNQPDLYRQFKLAVEIGYTNESNSIQFYNSLRVQPSNYTERELQGFTIIIHIIDPAGRHLLDDTTYGRYSYFRKALEIAHICPPVCGDLY